jgi:hypothetical protein
MYRPNLNNALLSNNTVESTKNGASTQEIIVQVTIDGRLEGVIQEMAKYSDQTREKFMADSLKIHVESILENPRILGDALTEKLRRQYQ